jgi:hypothetical protein
MKFLRVNPTNETVSIVHAANGETIDIGDCSPKPLWLKTREDVELAIAAGMVDRPVTKINGAVMWQWNKQGPWA